MPTPRTGDLSASLAVLGLLIERPDTVAGVRIRLEQRFPDAHWGRTAVDNNLASLVRQRHVQLAREGHRPTLSSYAATAAGVAHFRKWIRESVAVPPVLRDGLQGKLSFSTQDDLLALIETIRREKQAYRQRYATAHRRSLQMRRLQHHSAGGELGYDALVRGVMVADEAKLWGLNVDRLGELLEALERLAEDLPESGTGAATGAVSRAAPRAVRRAADG